jgi:prepilin-type N-terminal cleavage/methylation domain-containing protein
MTCAARIPEIPPAPFDKGGGPAEAFSGKPLSSAHAFPPLTKGGKGRFSDGFTLIEVIVTILMAAIMGAFFIQFMGTAMSRSSRSIENVRGEAAAEAIMEQIVADYVAEINNANPAAALGTIRGRSYGTSQISVNMGYITFTLAGAKQTTTLSRTLQVTVWPVLAPGSELVTLLTESRQAGPTASPPVAY